MESDARQDGSKSGWLSVIPKDDESGRLMPCVEPDAEGNALVVKIPYPGDRPEGTAVSWLIEWLY